MNCSRLWYQPLLVNYYIFNDILNQVLLILNQSQKGMSITVFHIEISMFIYPYPYGMIYMVPTPADNYCTVTDCPFIMMCSCSFANWLDQSRQIA